MAMLATIEEKRSDIRCRLKASITYALFNTDNYHDAEVVDVGTNGMSFRSKVPLKPGASIFIRMEKYPDAGFDTTAKIRPRSVTLAEVKWCRELGHKFETRYHIGVCYLYPDQ